MHYKVQLCYFHNKNSHSSQMSSYPKKETKSTKWKVKLKENHEREREKKKCFQATICIMPWIHPLLYSFFLGVMGLTFHCCYFILKSNMTCDINKQHLQNEQEFSMISEQNYISLLHTSEGNQKLLVLNVIWIFLFTESTQRLFSFGSSLH